MFRRAHQVNSLFHFLRERLPHYVPLLQKDAHELRDEVVRATVGAGVSAAAGLLLAIFVSFAVVVSAWDGRYRIMAAWMVCLAWAAIAIGGFFVAYKVLSGRPPPLRHMSAAFAHDYSQLVAALEQKE